ncbi:spore protein [Desulfuribacillus stibiiarsenatis]|uniref:Spore protein n=1 Tax=Desulfuribacillus stibiiarsenatis TaxID=1390249 RepID=A0A1E5L2T9_9FIRM|nr:alpha/beta-type small acid-soluble spore protein [Desulfuribacillus stibiiarsenatis]OEH84448.1 spore protein [Desulfuribacillus stibiiarsenatis]
MGIGQERPSNFLVVPEAYQALDQFKYEVASELGIQTPQNGYWGTMTSRDCGAVGGHITRKLVKLGEQQLMGGSSSSSSTF